MSVPLLDLKPHFETLRSELMAAVEAVCESQYFILGPVVERFERHVAAYCGARAAVGVSSGTDALLAALMASGIGSDAVVITTPYTFFATAGCIMRAGAMPGFCDIDPVTYNLAPAALDGALADARRRWPARRVVALMPVHLYGQMADMTPLADFARRHDLVIIEDACQAIGSQYRMPDGTVVSAGTVGLAGAFSFFPSKNLGGFGDGGMIVTQDEAFAERLRRFRNHGSHPKYVHPDIGGNFRLDALQAAVLDVKLPHLDDWHRARRANAARYDALFDAIDLAPPAAVYSDSGLDFPHIYNQYVIRVPERDRVRAALAEAGIGCEVYYPVPLHLQPCFAELGYREGDFPVSEQAARETLALPVYPELEPAMQEAVATALQQALKGG